MAKKSVMTKERKARIQEMLSSRNMPERDNSPMMHAASKRRIKASKKSYEKY